VAVEHLLQQTCICFDHRQSPKHRVFEATMARIGRLLDEQQEQNPQESGDQRAVDAPKQALKVQMLPYKSLLWQLVSCMHTISDVTCYTAWWLWNRHPFLQIYATLCTNNLLCLLTMSCTSTKARPGLQSWFAACSRGSVHNGAWVGATMSFACSHNGGKRKHAWCAQKRSVCRFHSASFALLACLATGQNDRLMKILKLHCCFWADCFAGTLYF